MFDPDTFLTTLYVIVDDFCHTHLPPERHPGPEAALSRSEVVTLSLLSQWSLFASERDFYRYAGRHLRGAFPRLPNYSQFNRSTRRHQESLVAFFLFLADLLKDPKAAYEVLDGTAAPTRNVKRRGRGWLAGLADIGWSNRLGWYHGLHVLLSVQPKGVITGFGFGPASTKDQRLADTFLALRAQPTSPLACVGAPVGCPYVADKGFQGPANRAHWRQDYQAEVISPPQRHKRTDPHPWPRALRRWLAGLRQIVETVVGKLQGHFRLGHDRPHTVEGFQTRLAAKAALHNFCLWLNRQHRRPGLAYAELIDW
jgi:DDE family transposase